MFWWTSLLYTLPVQEKDLVDRCEIVLVYLKPGVFGELQKIQPPTATNTLPHTSETPDASRSSFVIPQDVMPGTYIQDAETDPKTKPVITEGTGSDVGVSTESTTTGTKSELAGAAPTSSTATPHHAPQSRQPGSDPSVPLPPVLPDINIFMSQRCSIPLIRCDYESALKAANMHHKETEPLQGNDIPSAPPTSSE